MDTVLMSKIVPLSSNNLTPIFNHGCLYSEKVHTHGKNILLKVFTVLHSSSLDHMVYIPVTQEQITTNG